MDFEHIATDEAQASSRGQDARQGGSAGVPRIGALVNWAGAILSLGLVIGMAVWAYQLTVRDMSGVPVIRALEGPMRVAPADPGGTQAAHQGLAVNRLAEGAEAAPVPDQLILAPPPVDLDEVALASASASVQAPAPALMADAGALGELTQDQAQVPTAAAINAGTQALIERLMERADPIGPAMAQGQPEPQPQPELQAPGADEAVATLALATAADRVAVIPASVPGPSRSLRPPSRPEALAALALSTPDTAFAALAAAETEEIRADDLAEGTRLVQLGAFDTPEIARAEWDRLTARFPDYFDGRARVIQQASSGGSAFYRLRAHGFEDLAASRRFCAVLMAQSAPCIPVTVR